MAAMLFGGFFIGLVSGVFLVALLGANGDDDE